MMSPDRSLRLPPRFLTPKKGRTAPQEVELTSTTPSRRGAGAGSPGPGSSPGKRHADAGSSTAFQRAERSGAEAFTHCLRLVRCVGDVGADAMQSKQRGPRASTGRRHAVTSPRHSPLARKSHTVRQSVSRRFSFPRRVSDSNSNE